MMKSGFGFQYIPVELKQTSNNNNRTCEYVDIETNSPGLDNTKTILFIKVLISVFNLWAVIIVP